MESSSVSDARRAKRKKKFFCRYAKKGRRSRTLEPGATGFLVTCNNRERECVAEVLNILREFTDRCCPSSSAEGSQSTCGKEKAEEEDIETSLKEELDQLKGKDTLFESLSTGVRNCVFVECRGVSPCQLCAGIFDHMETDRKSLSRYIQRFLPVVGTCKAYTKDLEKLVESVCAEKGPFSEEATFQVNVKIRNNNQLGREEVIKAVIEAVTSHSTWKPDLANPQFVISVDVLQKVCCLSVAKDFFKYKKYNLVELGNSLRPVEPVKQ